MLTMHLFSSFQVVSSIYNLHSHSNMYILHTGELHVIHQQSHHSAVMKFGEPGNWLTTRRHKRQESNLKVMPLAVDCQKPLATPPSDHVKKVRAILYAWHHLK